MKCISAVAALGSGIVWLVALWPGLAAAQDQAATFNATCLKSGPTQAALNVARAQGFVTPPPQAVEKFKVPQIPGAGVLWKVRDGGLTMVIVGEGPLGPGSPLTADVCAVVDMPGQGDPEAGMQRLLGIGPPQDAGGERLFVFEDAAGSAKALPLSDEAAMQRVMRGGHMRMAAAKFQDGASLMLLMAPKLGQ